MKLHNAPAAKAAARPRGVGETCFRRPRRVERSKIIMLQVEISLKERFLTIKGNFDEKT
jgi:hypothetical protein